MNMYEEEGPKLCANGCGFFGTPSTHNLCSKCYNDCLKENLNKSAASIVVTMEKLTLDNSSTGTTSNANGTTLMGAKSKSDDDPNNVVKKKRCECCQKRVGLIGFGCSRCWGLYCGTHRYPEEHSCPFDFKKAGRADLIKDNPLCKGEKLETRI